MSRSAAKSRGEKSRDGSVPLLPPSSLSVETVDIIPGRLTENAWVTMITQEEGEEVVAELIAELKSRVLDKCYEVYLQKQLVPFTVSWAWDSLIQTVDWLFLLRDEDEGPENTPLWEEDPEAEPSTCDSWAEGCVPVHYYCVSSHTPLLQKLLDLHSAESDSQSKTSSKTTTTPENMEPDITEKIEPAKNSLHSASSNAAQRRQQPQPPPHKALPPPFRTPKPLLAAPKHTTQGPVTLRQGQVSCLPQPPPRRLRNIAVPKRLDPALLIQHHVWPEVEVLEPSLSQQSRGGLNTLIQPNQDQRNTGRRAATIPLTCYQRLFNTQKRSTVQRTQRHVLQLSVQPRGSTPDFTPLSTGLSLDTMALVPGVSLGSPAVGKPFSGREEPGWVPQLLELKPIRSSLPAPLWSLDQVVAGKSPTVTSPFGPH